MSSIRLVCRTISFGTLILIFLVLAALLYVLAGFSFVRARPYLNMLVSVICTLGLKVFGVSLRKKFQPPSFNENYLIVSNHMSYLDILIISSILPTCFVTSVEMKEAPFLGQLCLLGGCLFVERRSKAGITAEVAELTGALKSGLNVVIFPEATSTNGESVLRFRRPLFQAALNAHSKVLPVCINYRTLDGEKITLKNRDKVCWYGDMEFLTHAMALFAHKSLVAEITIMNSLNATDYEDKNVLTDKCFELVSKEFEIIGHAT